MLGAQNFEISSMLGTQNYKFFYVRDTKLETPSMLGKQISQSLLCWGHKIGNAFYARRVNFKSFPSCVIS